MTKESSAVSGGEISRYASLPLPIKIICLVLIASGLGLFIFYIFAWTPGGWVLGSIMYYYLLYTCFATCAFLMMPARKKDKNRIPWYDLVLAALVFGFFIYSASRALSIDIGWVPPPHTLALVLACIIGPLAIEGGRRMAGIPFVILTVIIGLYPLFAEHMPGVFFGLSLPFDILIGSFAYGRAGILGLPGMVMGEILIGYLMFAGMLMVSGAGRFFLNLALCLLGRFRGGPAKVAVLASGFFGSLSGAPIANIVATGAVTIPAMKRIGYPPYYAGAIEAVASTGGVIMPPVMGGIAFIMAILTGMPYSVIMIAAFIPAILYYYGLLVQVDAYAARVGLKGLPREELPSLLKTLKEGWVFIIAIAFLVFGLIYMRWGATAPVYASGLMFILSFASRETMMTPRRILAALVTIGSLVTFLMAILIAVGFVMIGIQSTGSFTTLTTHIVAFGGGNLVVVLLIAVAICYVFGMMGVSMAPYIVLAVTLIPSLAGATELSLIGLHLFVIYYVIMMGITPPIAISAFVAAAVAGAPPMKTGFTAMRLAVVLYFIPFFFVFNPALILEGPILETLYLFALCLVGIWILASGLEGYLLKVGRLSLWSRPLLVAGGFLIAFPGWMTTIIGVALTALVIALILIRKRTVAI